MFWRTTSPWKLRSIALPIEALIPAANTVTKTTTARPIISAAAVTAVRPGLRTAFSRARRPVMPRSFSSGQPATEASGRTSRGLNIDTPNSVATAPPPTRPAAAFDVDAAEQAEAGQPDAAEHQQHREGREHAPVRAALGQLGLEQRRHRRHPRGAQRRRRAPRRA